LDNLFTAASAISTTGLASVSVADNYTFFGQFIIVFLIQLGGLHYMTFGSLIMLMGRKKFSKLHETLVRNDFGLPDDFNIYDFLGSVIVFSLAIEMIGAIILYIVFAQHGVIQPLWNAVFHSISAFCTAGFSLFNTSFENFAADPMLNIVITILSFLGAIGFIVVTDFWDMIKGKKKSVTFTTKIILTFSVLTIAAGSVLIFLTNSFGENVPVASRIYMSVFQSMTAMTTVGFDSFPIASMSHSSLFLLVIFMFIGASPAGTGGGVKSTTIVAVFAQMFSTFQGKSNVVFMGRQVPNYRLRTATASFTFYIAMLSLGTYLLSLTDSHSLFELIFEATSALGTVGLSMGITGSLTAIGKTIIISLMMLGRIGALSIGFVLFSKKDGVDDLGWVEDVVI
jgi:trk system potassium uptake protein TrkH